MRDYFIRLFNYDKFANDTIIKTIIDAGQPDEAVKLIAHLLAAQQIWYTRCKGLPLVSGPLWPDAKVDTFTQTTDDNHAQWLNFLHGLNNDDFNHPISYKNLKGDLFTNKLVDILGHVINHGTHHRAQAGQIIKTATTALLPVTDYIFYLRTIPPIN